MTDFEDIYQQYSPQIYRVCLGYTNDAEQAKDLMQETFISVWKNLAGFRQEAQLGTWIFRIATNHCLRALEIVRRMPPAEMPLHLADVPEESPEEKLSWLYRAIATLNETDRIIISLELEGLPQAEIAAVVGLSQGNIRVKIHRIKEKLAKQLKMYERI
ncbi:sigma-70 family RNA polymerase sigma factor [Mucilaginibacter gynuensis]|uniref:Sigma-70 family RNA polymerase sigma factor n=1 Tax=Mucilaginibacter gynuensis TaxID=1302236 RepID=A0ABP8GMU6_9SPHI